MIQCDKCWFWEVYDYTVYEEYNKPKGECRKNPPINDHNGRGYWPITMGSDGCYSGKPMHNIINE